MRVISTHSFRFKRAGKDDVVLPPTKTPHHLPDDVTEDPMFGWAVKDGSITQVDAQPEAPAAPEPEPAAEAAPEKAEPEAQAEAKPSKKK